jgi:hypothetical protein
MNSNVFNNQQTVQKLLIDRGGNRGMGFDAWEGFSDVMPISSVPLNNHSYINELTNNTVNAMDNWTNMNTDFGIPRSLATNPMGIREFVTIKSDPTETSDNKSKTQFEEKFYKDDRILKGNYFAGWNDSYFFQSSVFRNNSEFWNTPFKTF